MKKRFAACSLAALLMLSACGQQTEPAPQPPPADSGGVQLNWDALTPYEAPENQYTRRYADYTDHLIPAGDYGTLIPFPGKAVYTDWGIDAWLYGLVTARGEIVVDPVYSSAYQISEYDYERQEMQYLPYLLLQKARPEAVNEEDRPDIAVAALDGSWVREGYARYFGFTDDLLVLGTEEERMEVLDGGGAVLWSKSAEELGVPEEAVRYADAVRIESGMLYYWGADGIYILDLAGAALTVLDRAAFSSFYGAADGVSVAQQTRDGTAYYGYVDRTGAWVIAPQYLEAEPFHAGRAAVTLPDGAAAVIDTQGEVLLRCETGQLLCSYDRGGSLRYLNAAPTEDVRLGEYRTYAQYEILAVYDDAFRPVDRPAAGERILWRSDGSYCILDGPRVTVCAGDAQTTIELPAGMLYAGSDLTDNGVFLEMERESDGFYLCGYYDRNGAVLVAPETYFWVDRCVDRQTGETYLVGCREGGYDILDAAGKPLPCGTGGLFPEMTGGLVLTQDLCGVSLRTLSGDLVFRYLVPDPDI